MMSSSDLPACPACGSREVRAVHRPAEAEKPAATFYACAQCGRDRTEAWEEVQPPPAPEKGKVPPKPAKKTIAQECYELGIAATVKP
jgi:DNA-directed RNA polymerase subunit RPC12/RpoP